MRTVGTWGRPLVDCEVHGKPEAGLGWRDLKEEEGREARRRAVEPERRPAPGRAQPVMRTEVTTTTRA